MSHRLVVLASGLGSTFEAIAEACSSGALPGEVVALITNRHCPANEKAQHLGINNLVLPSSELEDSEWDQQACEKIRSCEADLVILAGFLRKIGPQILDHFSQRILNTHPSLLPKFSGAGMYGKKVHQAVLDSNEKETGISVHIVTKNYDEGPVLAQCKIPVLPDDTIESLERRVKAQEPGFYIETIKKYLEEI